ncbi:MAG: transcription elongation factor GreA [Lachnospiraceae bacterium]|nr:transcription elongation factor GreA [Lachnospiraceae bacterium]
MYDELSEGDIKKIDEELEYRKVVLRHEILEDLKAAKAQGDLSENFEYHAAKRERGKNESRIRYLENMKKTAKIIKDESESDEVGLNNTVTVYFIEDDETEVYRIVTTIRGNTLKNMITIESPLGKALMGHKVGDTVQVTVNDSYSYEVRIEHIEKTEDESGDTINKY